MLLALGSVLLTGASAAKKPECDFGAIKAWMDSKSSGPMTPVPVAPTPVAPAQPMTDAPTTAPVTTAPVTTAPVTTAPVTTAPVTTAPVTTAPVTTAPVTTAPVTTAPVTTAPVTTAPVTTAPVTTAPVTTAPVTTAPVTTAPVTSAPTMAPITSAPTTAPSAPVPRFDPCQMTKSELESTTCSQWLQHFQCTDTWTTNVCPGEDHLDGPELNEVPLSEFCRSMCGLPPIFEVDWNPDFSKSQPLQLQRLDVEPGTELTFVWSGFHNVWQTQSRASRCNFDGATQVGTGTSGPVKFTLPVDAADGDKFHFACRVGPHCSMGQHLTVTVRKGSRPDQRRRLKTDESAVDVFDGLSNQCKPCVQSCVESEKRRLDFGSESLLECLMECTSVDCSALATQEACESLSNFCSWNEGTGVRRRLKAGICEAKPVLKTVKDEKTEGTNTEMMIAGAVVGGIVTIILIAGFVRCCRKKSESDI